MTTDTLTTTDLVKGSWTADDETTYEGYAHAERRWNGFRICYFTDDVMDRIVEEHGNGSLTHTECGWFLTDEGDRIYSVEDDGELVPFAQPVIVDGVRLWDTWESGWTWGAVETVDA